MVGAMNRVEVWDATSWSAYSSQQESAFADMNDEGFPGSEPGTGRGSTRTTARQQHAHHQQDSTQNGAYERGFNPQVQRPDTPSPVPGHDPRVSG